MAKLKVGIAGYGVVGKRRHDFIDARPLLKVVAVCDKNFAASGRLESGVACHPHYSKLLQEDLDCLFVCLPNELAPEVTIAGLERNLHVFCEKPPGKTVADIERVIAVERQHPGLKLKYGFNHRYHDSVTEALRLLRSGEIGDIVNMRGVYGKSMIVPFQGNWRAERKLAGGGILLDQGIHMLDLMRLFAGEFTEIKSFISNDYWHCDVEDNAYALLKDAKGRVAMLHSSATQWQHRFSLEIACFDGYLELHGILSSSKSYGEESLVIGRCGDGHSSQRQETVKYVDDHSWYDEICGFAECIARDRPIHDGHSADALATMQLVYAIYRADPAWAGQYQL